MDKEIIGLYLEKFNERAYRTDEIEFWFARDLQELLGYKEWRNFEKVIGRAKVACRKAGVNADDHFAASTRTVEMPKGGTKEIDDIIMSRYGCYLTAQNGDPAKEAIAFAMSYFAVQTRKQEILQKRIDDWERLRARDKLSYSEKVLSGVMYERGVDHRGFAAVRSRGDQALFGGHSTEEMKARLGVSPNRALADFLPTITIKAKDFANEITIFNMRKDRGLSGQVHVEHEHVKNNEDVRRVLIKRGIKPEDLPPEEDLRKLERRVKADNKRLAKDTKKIRHGGKEMPDPEF